VQHTQSSKDNIAKQNYTNCRGQTTKKIKTNYSQMAGAKLQKHAWLSSKLPLIFLVRPLIKQNHFGNPRKLLKNSIHAASITATILYTALLMQLSTLKDANCAKRSDAKQTTKEGFTDILFEEGNMTSSAVQ